MVLGFQAHEARLDALEEAMSVSQAAWARTESLQERVWCLEQENEELRARMEVLE